MCKTSFSQPANNMKSLTSNSPNNEDETAKINKIVEQKASESDLRLRPLEDL